MELKPEALSNALLSDVNSCLFESSPVGEASRLLLREHMRKFKGSRSLLTEVRAVSGFITRAAADPIDIQQNDLPHARMYCSLELPSSSEMYSGMRCGPGSSQHSFSRSTSGYYKTAQNLSCYTMEAYEEYVSLLAENDTTAYAHELLRVRDHGVLLVKGAKLTTVAKDDEIDRCIAVEATVNSMLQQGVMSHIVSFLLQKGIILKTQPGVNQKLARRGSLDGSLATVDFSAASDSISWELLNALLPVSVVDYIRLVSAPTYIYAGMQISTRRICLSMGNAITFPLQTLIFASLAYEVYRRKGIPFSMGHNVSVFGDDVVVDQRVLEDFLALTARCGFTPNVRKTFGSECTFRESCGSDWYQGFNVRPVYIRQLENLHDVYVVYNLLHAWARRWGVTLWETDKLILAFLRKHQAITFVPMHASLDSGIRVPSSSGLPGMKTDANGSIIYKARVRRFSKRPAIQLGFIRYFMWCHVRGYLRSGKLQERPVSKAISRCVWRVTPHWGHVNDDDIWLYDESCTTSGFQPIFG